MARLTTMASRLATAPPRLATVTRSGPDRSRLRDEQVEWRKWYKTARWQKLRMSVLVRDLFTCARCDWTAKANETHLLVADHRLAHRGDEVLFWDDQNLQCLCKPCHDKDKQREERRVGR